MPEQDVPDGDGTIPSPAEPLTSAIRLPFASYARVTYVWLLPATIVELAGVIVTWSSGPGSNVTVAVCVTGAAP